MQDDFRQSWAGHIPGRSRDFEEIEDSAWGLQCSHMGPQ
jgi:hypothetical protein